MGFDLITGPELTEKFQYQLIHSHYIDHLMSDVEKIEATETAFSVTTSELKTYLVANQHVINLAEKKKKV